jgi:phthalate 4,5-dioxygenase oxygenase subunit
MTSAAQNDLMTQVGPGTPAGALLRRYWQPVALSDELKGPRPVRPVTVFGEKLVLFRDESGQLGLIARNCAHRGADLCYGRLEDGGLRCPFHGWLFETPAEPEDSTLHERVTHASYPVIEKNGMIFGYLGEGVPPALPNLDCLAAPESHSFAFKGFVECNWLQVLEVGMDPAHASYLHRFLEDEDASQGYGQQFRDDVDNIPTTTLRRDYARKPNLATRRRR